MPSRRCRPNGPRPKWSETMARFVDCRPSGLLQWGRAIGSHANGTSRLTRSPPRYPQALLSGVLPEDSRPSSSLDQVSFDAGVLYVGCRLCPDASPDRFQVEHVAPIGFWGHWDNPMTGCGWLWIAGVASCQSPQVSTAQLGSITMLGSGRSSGGRGVRSPADGLGRNAGMAD
jgi:hypothetical protein